MMGIDFYLGRNGTWNEIAARRCRDFARAIGTRTGDAKADACIINILDQKVTNLNPDFLSYTLGKTGLASLTAMLAMAPLCTCHFCSSVMSSHSMT